MFSTFFIKKLLYRLSAVNIRKKSVENFMLLEMYHTPSGKHENNTVQFNKKIDYKYYFLHKDQYNLQAAKLSVCILYHIALYWHKHLYMYTIQQINYKNKVSYWLYDDKCFDKYVWPLDPWEIHTWCLNISVIIFFLNEYQFLTSTNCLFMNFTQSGFNVIFSYFQCNI